jgi:hypothetical protein
MNDLPPNHSLGTEFFRLSGLRPLSADDYFRCLNLLRPLFSNERFSVATPGFYINRITNASDDQGNSLRLTHYTTNPEGSLKAIKDFGKGQMAIFESKDTNRPDLDSPLDSHDQDQLRFRNFLNRTTRICLEVLKGFGEHSFQELVTQYRYVFLPQRIPPELIFGPVFDRHSGYFIVGTLRP